jgi:predicted dehydrogenase
LLRCISSVSKGLLTEAYPLKNNFFLNLKFKNGAHAQVRGLYDVVEPMLPMMQIILYGSKGTAVAEFTDNKPGCLKLTFDGESGVESEVIDFEPETDRSVYGHGATVKRYMRHFQDCIDNDSEPSPNVIDGAKACAVASAAWASSESGAVEKVFNEF